MQERYVPNKKTSSVFTPRRCDQPQYIIIYTYFNLLKVAMPYLFCSFQTMVSYIIRRTMLSHDLWINLLFTLALPYY